LADDVGILASVNDIVDNPLNIEFVEIDPSQLVNALPDVSAAVINGNYAIEGGLSVSDAIAVEADDGLAAQTYANILVTTSANADNPALLRLAEVLQSDEIQTFIEDTYDGAVVPLN
jgi:D-methionine transport system substrate-binding protein